MEETTSPPDPHPPHPPQAPRPLPEPGFVTGAAYGVLIVLGAVLGAVGSFEFSWEAGRIPVAAIVLCLVNLVAFRAAGWAMESRLGVAAMIVPWLIVVMTLSGRRPEGDLVVTGTWPGYVFLFGGMAAAVLAVVWTRPARSWLLTGAGPAAGSGP